MAGCSVVDIEGWVGGRFEGDSSWQWVCVCMCRCICERETERESERKKECVHALCERVFNVSVFVVCFFQYHSIVSVSNVFPPVCVCGGCIYLCVCVRACLIVRG